MISVTSTEIRRDSARVYNLVHSQDMVTLKHRDRPDMIIINKDLLEKALFDDGLRAALVADLTF